MASIPRYQPDQRIGQQGPQEASDPGFARKKYTELGSVADKTMDAATAYARASYIQKRSEDSLIQKEFGDEALIRASDAKEFVKSGGGGQVTEDGKNMLPLYDNSFQDLYEKAKGLPPAQQRAAIHAINKGRMRYRNDVVNGSIVRWNAFTFSKSEESVNKMGVKIYSDPNLFMSAQDDERNFQKSLSLGGDNEAKVDKLISKTAAVSVLNRYKDDKNFAEAEKALKGPLANYFNADEHNKAMDDIRRERSQHLADKKNEVDAREAALRLRHKQEKESASIEIRKDIVSNEPGGLVRAQMKADEYYKMGLIDKTERDSTYDIDNLRNRPGKTDTYNIYINDLLQEKNLSGFVKRVSSNPAMTESQKVTLMDTYTKLSDSNSVESKRMGEAKEIIDSAFPQKPGQDPEIQQAKKQMALQAFLTSATGETGAGNFEYQKMAVDAIGKVDSSNIVVKAYSGQGLKLEGIKARQLQIKNEVEKLKAAGTLTKEQRQRFESELLELRAASMAVKSVPVKGE